MGLPVTVYRSDDVGAPNISTGYRSAVLNVLKKCLVEGYGSKASLGWSIVSETSGEAVAFRNSKTNGGGHVVRVYSSSTASNAPMSFICSSDYIVESNSLIRTGQLRTFQTGAGETAWILIGTARGFYFQTWNPSANNNSTQINVTMGICIFAGEIDSFFDTDANPMACISANSTSHDYSASQAKTIADIDDGWGASVFYDLDNTNQSGLYKIAIGLDKAGGTDWTKNGGTHTSTGIPLIIQDVIIKGAGNPWDVDYYGVPQSNSLTRPYTRGKLPGLYRMNCCLYADQPWPTILSVDGVDYYAMPYKYGVNTLIKLDTWYD